MERETRNKLSNRLGLLVWLVPPIVFGLGYLNARAVRLEREAERDARSDFEAATDDLRDGANHGNIVIDVEGRVVGWNAAMVRWTGYTTAEMTGRTLERVMPPEKWEQHRLRYAKFMSDPKNIGRRVPLVCEMLPKPGSGLEPFWVEITARAVRPRGRPLMAVAFVDRERVIKRPPEAPTDVPKQPLP